MHSFVRNVPGLGHAQIIIIPQFIINVLRPAFLVSSEKLIDSIRLSLGIVIRRGEMVPVILHRAVHAATAFEVKARPSFDLLGLSSFFPPIWQVETNQRARFPRICLGSMHVPFESTFTARQRSV